MGKDGVVVVGEYDDDGWSKGYSYRVDQNGNYYLGELGYDG